MKKNLCANVHKRILGRMLTQSLSLRGRSSHEGYFFSFLNFSKFFTSIYYTKIKCN